jgi:cysteinyl-tRNA synthetase
MVFSFIRTSEGKRIRLLESTSCCLICYLTMSRALHLYDTMTRSILPVTPADGQSVHFYCCGPTVYGPAHIGNFRTFVLQDVARRVMELNGTAVVHVRNVTDVDDKTIRQSQAEGKTLKAFTDFWLNQFREDAQALHLLPPHVEPGAVDHIPQQVGMVQRLLEKQHAYTTADGSVYFRVQSFPLYGRLSRLQEREITTNPSPQGLTQADEYSRDSMADFALWKAHKAEDGDNHWESPWGRGRPGWHLECSCMSQHYLGESFDLHGGGVDLIFPHHENEIAQSEAITGKVFARHWFHITHLLVEGRKMSKSDGNLYTLADLEAKGFSAMEVRYVLLAGHYHKPLNFTLESLSVARQALQTLFRLDQHLQKVSGSDRQNSYQELVRSVPQEDADDAFAKAWSALLKDLNTPEALGQLFVTAKETEAQIRAQTLSPESAGRTRHSFHRLLQGLGLTLKAPVSEEIPLEIVALAQQRWEAKQAKNWGQADALRSELIAKGWLMQDQKDSYTLVKS